MHTTLVGYHLRAHSESAEIDPDSAVGLGQDGRGVLFAASRGVSDPTAGGSSAIHDDDGVVLRRSPASDADTVVRALTRGAGDHVQPVLDIGTAPNGDTVLVLPDTQHSVADLLEAGPLPPGEIVTILVPIAQTLARLHDVGVAHGALSPAAIGFDRLGAPVLIHFGSSVCRHAAGRDDEFDAAVEADDRAIAALSTRLLVAAGGVAVSQLLRAQPWEASRAIELLFDWADPQPVRFDRPSDVTTAGGTPERMIPVEPVAEGEESALDGHRLGSLKSRIHVPTRAALQRALAPLLERLRRRATALPRVRARVWGAAAGSALLLIAAIVLLPEHGADAASRPAALPSHTPHSRAPGSDTLPSATPSRAPRHDPADPTSATDPARAVSALIAARAVCIQRASVECLASVDSVGSPVAVQDAAAITAGVEAVMVPTGTPVLRAQSGSTATFSLGTATLLLFRQDNHWRLRDVVAEPHE